jgi:F420-dependent oxidoreductase-like protein
MKIGMPIAYAGGFKETVAELGDYESAGLDAVLLPEVYTFDSVSQIGFIAARTERLELCTSILNIYSRTPALLAMTAAGLDHVSDGRFVLGIGASGPQVVEGFHGVRYDAPLARTREIADICRSVWRREKLEHHGRHYDIPLTPERGGSGLGKPLKLINTPLRADIPMVLAALGPKNVALAAELFEGWEPIFYLPERAHDAFGEALEEGRSKRSADLPPLDIAVDTRLLVSEDAGALEAARQQVREHLALYVGGMGARGKNFYNDLAVRFGFEEAAARIQDLFLAGSKAEAAAAVPDELVDGISLIGSRAHVADRVQAYREVGVTTLNAAPLAPTHEQRVADIATLKELSA